MSELTADRLRAVLHYDPATGEFTRKVKLAQRHRAGDRADFAITDGPMAGYMRVSVDYQRHLAHRLAWLFVYGEWPSGQLDHINTQRGDNRIANLRCVSEQLNHQNIRQPKRNNKSGFLGVVSHQGRWRASVTHNRKVIRIGMFDTPEQAHAAYVQAKRKIHEGCTI